MGSCLSQPLQKVQGPSKAIIGGTEVKKADKDIPQVPSHENTSNNAEDSESYSYDYEEYEDDNSDINEAQENGAEIQHKVKIRRIRKPKHGTDEKNSNSNNQNNCSIKIQSSNDPSSAQTRPYFSFTSFMIQNPNPQIYEWHFEEEIAKGSLSQIYLVRHSETGQVCAAKVYNNAVLHLQTIGNNEEQPFLCVKRDIDVVCSISHPNIISIHEVIEDNPTNSLILVVPYASQGNFGDHILLAQSKQYKDNQDPIMTVKSILVCFYQMCEALNYLHSVGYAHRNICPQSILILSDFYFSLAEFKFAEKIIDESKPKSNIILLTDAKGSSFYLSPEACSGKPYDGRKNDIWALGVTFYLAFYGKHPFCLSEKAPISVALAGKSISEKMLEFPPSSIPIESNNIENSIQLILGKMLEKDPKKRISLDECINSSLFNEAKEITNSLQKEAASQQ